MVLFISDNRMVFHLDGYNTNAYAHVHPLILTHVCIYASTCFPFKHQISTLIERMRMLIFIQNPVIIFTSFALNKALPFPHSYNNGSNGPDMVLRNTKVFHHLQRRETNGKSIWRVDLWKYSCSLSLHYVIAELFWGPSYYTKTWQVNEKTHTHKILSRKPSNLFYYSNIN